MAVSIKILTINLALDSILIWFIYCIKEIIEINKFSLKGVAFYEHLYIIILY